MQNSYFLVSEMKCCLVYGVPSSVTHIIMECSVNYQHLEFSDTGSVSMSLDFPPGNCKLEPCFFVCYWLKYKNNASVLHILKTNVVF